MKKLNAILLFMLNAFPTFAGGELGALNDSRNGDSSFSIGIGLIIGLAFCGFIAYMWLTNVKDGTSDKDLNQLGCMAVIGIAAAIIFLMILFS